MVSGRSTSTFEQMCPWTKGTRFALFHRFYARLIIRCLSVVWHLACDAIINFHRLQHIWHFHCLSIVGTTTIPWTKPLNFQTKTRTHVQFQSQPVKYHLILKATGSKWKLSNINFQRLRNNFFNFTFLYY